MTFTEAAVEVLRLVGRPLHYKKITEVAIERNLLSHVGKSPEITMSSRLATMVKKDRGDAPIVKVKPGIFGLREFSKEVLAMGELEEGDVEEILEAIDDADATEAEEAVAEKDETPKAETVSVEVEKPSKPAHKLPGQEVFPEEEDDDEPILGKADEPSAEGAESEEARRNKKRRRKKRRGGEGEAGAPDEPREVRTERPERGDRDRNRGERDRNRGDRDRNRGDRDRDRGPERAERADRGERDRADRDRGDRGDRGPRREPEVRGDWQREPSEGDLSGKDLADAIESALAQRGGKALLFVEIADALVQRGRLSGDPQALAPTIAAAVRGDIARRNATSQKPRFRVRYGEVALLDQLLGGEVARAEQEVTRSLSRHRELVHRALVRKLQELPNASLLEVLATWLNAVSVTSLRGVRRAGAGAGEFHLAGVLRRGQEEVPVAIVIVRDGQVGRERVIDVRGSLHRYGDARMAWIVSIGNVQGGARDEAGEPGGAPVAVYDGMQLARSLEDAGVGVRRFSLPLLMVDFDLFEELRGPGAPPRAPREPEQRLEPRVARAPEPIEADDFEGDAESEPEATDRDEGAEATETKGEVGEAGEAGAAKRRRRRRRRRRRGGPEEGTGAEGGEAAGSEGEAGESDEDDDEDALVSGDSAASDDDADLAGAPTDDDEDEPILERSDSDSDLEDDLDRDRDRDLDEDDDEVDVDRDLDEDDDEVDVDRDLDDDREPEDDREPADDDLDDEDDDEDDDLDDDLDDDR